MKRLAALVAVAVLGGCSDGSILGLRSAPDELAVIDGPPLSLPPDFELRPPQKGSTATVVSKPTKSGQEVLTGQTPAEVKPAGDSPKVDEWLIKQAGGQNRDPKIRDRLIDDAKPKKKDKKWYQFWGDDTDTPETDAAENAK